MAEYDDCTTVSAACPVEATIFGYAPSLPANAVFLAISALCAIVQVYLGVRYKTWAFMTGLLLGCITQAIGYAGRILMEPNAWNDTGFTIQITCLIIGPAFISASIYLTLKHFALALGSDKSIIRPKWYTWLFISADILSILLQAAGGALASAADDEAGSDMGGNIMLAGIVWQVVALATFGGLAALYAFRVYQGRATLSVHASNLLSSRPFMVFVGAIALAYITILIRFIYRIPELAGGWGNELMRKEVEFILLDNLMVTIAIIALTVAHPGFCFPGLVKGHEQEVLAREKQVGSGSESDIPVVPV